MHISLFSLNKSVLSFICFLTLSVIIPGLVLGQEDMLDEANKKAIRLYVDCSDCDFDYLRKELTFVNYVRDRNDAQVYILVTTQTTGSGGNEYTVTFLGKQDFAGINDTLTFTMKKNETADITRKELARTMKLGLIRYASKTPLADKLFITYQQAVETGAVTDQWDYWVFSLGLSMYGGGEQLYKYKTLNWSANANRTTDDMKINLALGFNYSDNDYTVGDENILSVQRSRNFKSQAVFSLSDHWSWGGSASYYHSTYSNMDYYLAAGPALEYNLFPYSESTRRQMRFLYKINYNYAKYIEQTIYGKNSENLFDQSLTISFDMKEPWGSSGISIGGSHYFHDAQKYSLTLSGSISFRLIQGLSLDLYGNYSRIHNQLSLPKAGADRDETLLRIRQLETNYDYFFMVGLSYTFGSIYNNIVNPRFGSGSSGTTISISY